MVRGGGNDGARRKVRRAWSEALVQLLLTHQYAASSDGTSAPSNVLAGSRLQVGSMGLRVARGAAKMLSHIGC